MPSWPWHMPSHTAIVSNSLATPPASTMPCFTHSPSRRKWMCPGTISFQEFTTATSGFSKSSRVMPVAYSSARCAARSRPWVINLLRVGFMAIPS